MKLCRFNDDRLGYIEEDNVYDVTAALRAIPSVRWPFPSGDPFIENIESLCEAARQERKSSSTAFKLSDISLKSFLTSPSKIMAAPANYRAHVEQDTKDPEVDAGVHAKALEGIDRPAETYGLFLKAASSIVGPSEGIRITFPDRRTDYEVELAVIIGKECRNIEPNEAMTYVAGYCIGLDMTVRGSEDRSFRKSPDTYTVLGPAFVTADEITDPHELTLSLWLNEERRQHSSTGLMTVDIPDLIALASKMYTLHPGDVILTGTPEGVGSIKSGDVIRAECTGLGSMSLVVS